MSTDPEKHAPPPPIPTQDARACASCSTPAGEDDGCCRECGERLTDPDAVATGRALGRAHRTNRSSPVYAWLDSLSPPRTLLWLAGELGVSRQSLQNYVNGERHQRSRQKRKRIAPAACPYHVFTTVRAMSDGAVSREAWPGGVADGIDLERA